MDKWRRTKIIQGIIVVLLICAVLALLRWFLFAPETFAVLPPESPVARLEPPEKPPILERIARCESGNTHFTDTGGVLRGYVNSYDVGKYQINEQYHLEKAQELGMNIYTEEGNEAYALWLFEKYGTAPWKWSEPCWSKI